MLCYYLHQGGYVIVVVCLFVSNCVQKLQTDLHEIFSEGWQWASEQMIKFGGDLDHRLDTGIVFQIHSYWEMQKVVNRHSFRLIRQMAALVRRALAEVCTVRVLLVYSLLLNSFLSFSCFNGYLWPTCVADVDIIFLPCGFFLLSFSRRLILAVIDWMSTILLNMVCA